MDRKFERALRAMRRRDPQAAEDGFGALREIADEHVDELIGEFERETDHGLRCWLLELIGEARSPKGFDLLVAQLHGDDESLRSWAQRGLRLLDTKDARRILWENGVAPAGGLEPGDDGPTLPPPPAGVRLEDCDPTREDTDETAGDRG